MITIHVGEATVTVENSGRDYAAYDSGYRQQYTYVITTADWEYVGNDIRSGVGADVDEIDATRTLLNFLAACGEGRMYAGTHSENAELFPEHVAIWAEQYSDDFYGVPVPEHNCQRYLAFEGDFCETCDRWENG